MKKFFRLFWSNGISLYLLELFFIGINFNNNLSLLSTSLLIAVMIFFIKPILKILTLPFQIVTLGFFDVILNGLIFYFVIKFIPGFELSDLSLRYSEIGGLNIPKYTIVMPFSLIAVSVLNQIFSTVIRWTMH